MPSFDVVSEVDLQEVRNAVDQTSREINTRFDFKGTNTRAELVDKKINLLAPTDFQLKQLRDIFEAKLLKRGIALGSIEFDSVTVTLSEAKQTVSLKQGLSSELAKKLSKIIKDSKLKVQVAIQGEQLRVTGKNRDDLQEAIALLKTQKIEQPLQYTNYRD